MAYELLYTSVPRGIRPGSSGFCTAAYTNGLAANVVMQLEGMSAYKAYFPHYDANADRNPVSYSHFVYYNSGVEYHILSRICFYGVDYTKRSNKLAHHIVAKKSETDHVSGGPGSVFAQDGLFRTQWTGEPRLFHDQKHLTGSSVVMRKAVTWEKYCSDSGWAGVLAEAFLTNPKKPCFVIFDPLIHTDVLSMVEEALLLLPESFRWKVCFNTYFSTLPAGLECHWRFCVPDSDALKEARRTPGTLVIDLTGKLGTPPESAFVRAARSGVAVQGESGTSLFGSEDHGSSERKPADPPGKIPGKNALPGVPPPVAGIPPLPVRKKDSDVKLWIMAGILFCFLLSCGIVALCLFANSMAPKKSDRAIRLEQQLAKKKAEKAKMERKQKAETPKKAKAKTETPKKKETPKKAETVRKQQSKTEKSPVIRAQKKEKKQVHVSSEKKEKLLNADFQKIRNENYSDFKNIVKSGNLNALYDFRKKIAADLDKIGEIRKELRTLSSKIISEKQMTDLETRLKKLKKETDRIIRDIVKKSRGKVWYRYDWSKLSSDKGSLVIEDIFSPLEKIKVDSILVKIGEKLESIRPEGNNIFSRKENPSGFNEVVSFSSKIEVDPVRNGLKITVLQPSKSKLQWQEIHTSSGVIYCHFSRADNCHIPFDKIDLSAKNNDLICSFIPSRAYRGIFEQNGYERIFCDLKVQVMDGDTNPIAPLKLTKYGGLQIEAKISYRNQKIIRNDLNKDFQRFLLDVRDLLEKEYSSLKKVDNNGDIIGETKLGRLDSDIKSLNSKISANNRMLKEKDPEDDETEKIRNEIRLLQKKKSDLDRRMRRLKCYRTAKEKGNPWQKIFFHVKRRDFYKCDYKDMETVLKDLRQSKALRVLKEITPAGWKKYDPGLPRKEIEALIARIRAGKSRLFLRYKDRVLKDSKLEVDKK